MLVETLDPKDTNAYGSIFGGVIMGLMDKAAAVAAWRYARMRVVTASAEEITFVTPIRVGEVVTVEATIVYVGRSSMEIDVTVEAEDVVSGDSRRAAAGVFTMVAVDDRWAPARIPPWIPATPAEKERAEEAAARKARRRGQR